MHLLIIGFNGIPIDIENIVRRLKITIVFMGLFFKYQYYKNTRENISEKLKYQGFFLPNICQFVFLNFDVAVSFNAFIFKSNFMWWIGGREAFTSLYFLRVYFLCIFTSNSNLELFYSIFGIDYLSS